MSSRRNGELDNGSSIVYIYTAKYTCTCHQTVQVSGIPTGKRWQCAGNETITGTNVEYFFFIIERKKKVTHLQNDRIILHTFSTDCIKYNSP